MVVEEGRCVYIKRYSGAGSTIDSRIACQRTAREADVIRRVSSSGIFNDRLGVLKLVDADASTARIATEKVSGQPLQCHLLGPYSSRLGSECLWAMYMAGRWLSQFQRLAIEAGDEARFSENDPADLLEYCRLRFEAIARRGDRWATEGVRRELDRRIGSLLLQAGSESQVSVWSHGDYNAANLIWDGERLTAIDFAMAKVDHPLLDVAGFIHRLELLPMLYPWRRWPLEAWRLSFLWGYGHPDCDRTPMFKALAIRHLLCRLLSYNRVPKNVADSLHNAWLRRCVRKRLIAAVAQGI